MATQVRQIRINVDTKGSKELQAIASSLGGITREVSSASGILRKFNSIFNATLGASFLGLGVKSLTDMSDSMQLLSSRIGILTGDTEGVNAVISQLNEVSSRTKASIDDTATAFTRIASTTKGLGISTTELLQITEGLQETFRLSGATSEEATGGLIQFSQALSLGKLSGQEFRSVMLSNVVYADLLAKSMGVSRGQLQKFAEAGKITTTQMLKPLQKNLDDLKAKGEQMGQTFEQTVTVSMNNMKVAIGNLNKEWGLSSKFATSITFLVENLPRIIASMGVMATLAIPQLIKGIRGLGTALLALNLNPWVIGITALATATFIFWDDLKNLSQGIARFFQPLGSLVLPFLEAFESKLKSIKNIGKIDIGIASGLRAGAEFLAGRPSEPQTSLVDARRADDAAFTKSRIEAERLKKEKEDAAKREAAIGKKDLSSKDKEHLRIAELNRQYKNHIITLDQYAQRLRDIENLKISDEMEKGRSTVFKYNEAILETMKIDLQGKFKEGAISASELKRAVNEIDIASLEGQLKSGQITVAEFNKELISLKDTMTSTDWQNAIFVGVQDYLDSIGTFSEGISGVVSSAFNNLDSAILKMTKNGKINFAEFTQSVLDDLSKVIIKSMIIKPLAESILNSSSGGQVSAGTSSAIVDNQAANGAMFMKKASYFASGGVVGSPTAFSYGAGKLGIMGEKGPEAILPLSRGSGGQLGVQANMTPVVVNIVNQNGSQVEQRETSGPNGEKMIDILILSKVKEAIGGGQLDKSFQQAFGLRRQGY